MSAKAWRTQADACTRSYSRAGAGSLCGVLDRTNICLGNPYNTASIAKHLRSLRQVLLVTIYNRGMFRPLAAVDLFICSA
jgi:hypothetical protein